MNSRVLFVVVFVVAIMLLPVSANASSQNCEKDRTGSVLVVLRGDSDSGEFVSGAEVGLYRLAEVKVEDVKMYYTFPENFGIDRVDTAQMYDSLISQKAEQYVRENKIPESKSALTDCEGMAFFSDIPSGLYLVRQNKAVEGYYRFKPFVVSMPMREEENGNKLSYCVEAYPKVQEHQAESEEIYEEKPGHNIESSESVQTGDAGQPVIALLICGILLIITGGLLFKR